MCRIAKWVVSNTDFIFSGFKDTTVVITIKLSSCRLKPLPSIVECSAAEINCVLL